ncbi:MAG: 3-ketoacyl-ACP reductase [Sulfobacillus benefaciens]|uniref:3-ketoacyl-ACP reductase n=1 Tax=Sulfobacillus benefaciens TaxID=453960 RepID=A0A2T2XF38_9FIRM|nr:MAG: 3-ketoacyl-ACP reductase [Sulfobacillus benefaciens]
MADNQGVAIVTGGSRGIGEAISRRLYDDGFTVAVLDLVAPDNLISDGVVQHFTHVDVTSASSVSTAVQEIVATYGMVDVLCNNAGVSTMQRVVDMTEEEWDFNFSVNTKGVFLMTKAVLPIMIRQQRGVIINTASMAGVKGVPLLAHYAASKWAVIGFTKSVALEVAQYGIRVNAVCPGFVKTSMQERELGWEGQLRGMAPSEVFDEYIRLTPMQRIEEPEDVAKVVGFLAGPDAAFITGEAINVTGGANL